MSALPAAVSAGLAVWLLLAGGAGVPSRLGSGGSTVRRTSGAWPGLLVATAAGGVAALLDGTALALGLVLVGGSAGGWQLLVRVRRRRAAAETAGRVVEVCEALAGELRAGQPPLTALRHCAQLWPALGPAATAAELGADVPAALRRLAAVPGAAGLREVAAAWQVSQTSGGTMAVALARVADSARRRRATQQLVTSELASAQATARLVALLPVVVLAMGTGLGGDPWGFLLTSPAGLACLAAGLGLTLAGLWWIERIASAAVES
jgi:tight adherence protein B